MSKVLTAIVVTCIANVALGDPSVVLPGSLQIRLNRIASGLGDSVGSTPQVAPIDYSVIPDGSGRAIVATLGGVLRLVDKDGTLNTSYLDTTTNPVAKSTMAADGEWGFHSVAVHPGFNDLNSPGYQKFYTLNSRSDALFTATFDDGLSPSSNTHQDVLIEWTVNQLDASNFSASAREVFSVDQPRRSHNVVDLAFDNQGLLYIASGDGGGSNSVNGSQARQVAAQDARNVYGTILRIDPTNPSGPNANLTGKSISANQAYSIPNSNHFAADGNSATLPEVYAVGLRSPWRMNFDSATGDLYVGNVGDLQREAIFKISNGSNAGWGRLEGTRLNDSSITLAAGTSYTAPIGTGSTRLEYDHGNIGFCVVGGFVYRGTALPDLVGKYVFGDLGEDSPTGSARLFYGIVDPLASDFGQIYEFQIDLSGDQLPLRLMSIGQDADGELILLAGTDPRPNNFTLEGVLLKVVPVPEPQSIALLAIAAVALSWKRFAAARRG